jgi:HD-GYP domain-containing protein (c-di-GMP phosphodiesterase class II)
MNQVARSGQVEGSDEQALGREVVRTLLLALRTVRTHGSSNQISVANIDSCVQAMQHVTDLHGKFEVHLVEDFLYLGDTRLRPERSDFRLFEALIQELTQRRIGALTTTFAVQRRDVLSFIQLLHRYPAGGEELHETLGANGSPFSIEEPLDLRSRSSNMAPGGVRSGTQKVSFASPSSRAGRDEVRQRPTIGPSDSQIQDPSAGSSSLAQPGIVRLSVAGEVSDSAGPAGPAGPPLPNGGPTRGTSGRQAPGAAPNSDGLATTEGPSPGFAIAVPKSAVLSIADPTSSQGRRSSSVPSRGQESKRAFFTAISVYKSMHHGLHIGEPIQIRHAKRTVQNLVDQILDEEFSVLGLTALKTQDNYAFFHSVNVAVLSIALGKRLGLTPNQLVELGTGALFHDIGKVSVPLSILRKPGKLTEAERAMIQLHPQMGVQELLRIGGLDPQLYPAMVGCFEHHMGFDAPNESYPRVDAYRPHVYGRIISIADCFDALSTRRIYMKRLRSKGQALAWMMSHAGTKFDPTLLKLFVNQVGIHPVGSVVRLRSGRLGVVIRTPENPGRCHHPIVSIIDPATSIPEAKPLDLSVRGLNGEFADEIVETLEADEVGIDMTRVLAGASEGSL